MPLGLSEEMLGSGGRGERRPRTAATGGADGAMRGFRSQHDGLFGAGKMSPLLAAMLMPMCSTVSLLIIATISRERDRNKG